MMLDTWAHSTDWSWRDYACIICPCSGYPGCRRTAFLIAATTWSNTPISQCHPWVCLGWPGKCSVAHDHALDVVIGLLDRLRYALSSRCFSRKKSSAWRRGGAFTKAVDFYVQYFLEKVAFFNPPLPLPSTKFPPKFLAPRRNGATRRAVKECSGPDRLFLGRLLPEIFASTTLVTPLSTFILKKWGR